MRKDGTRLINSRKYLLLSGNYYFGILKNNKVNRTLIFELQHDKGELSIEVIDLNNKNVQSIKEPTSNCYRFNIDKGANYRVHISTKNASGSYSIRLSKKDIRVIIPNASLLDDMTVFHVSKTDLIINDRKKGYDIQMFRKYEVKYQKLFKNLKANNIIVLQENLSQNEMSYLCEKIYKKPLKNIIFGVYDNSFLKEYAEIIDKYHLDIREIPKMDELKPRRPYVIH